MKKKNAIKLLYLSTLFGAFISCSSNKIQQRAIPSYTNNQLITDNLEDDEELNKIIAPYKKELNDKMNTVVSYTPIDLHKNGFNSPLCNLVADAIKETSDEIYFKDKGIHVDLSLINNGGIRRTFSKGNLTNGNIIELLPFENEVVILTLTGESIKEMADFLLKANTGHGVSGIVIKNENEILINNKPLDLNKTYTLSTNDYLYHGGDNMFFLKKAIDSYLLTNIKLRDLMLSYLKTHPTIQVNTDIRIYK